MCATASATLQVISGMGTVQLASMDPSRKLAQCSAHLRTIAASSVVI
jgi:hypothetical protein